MVGENVLNSNELVTEFTIPAERTTEKFTGIPIDSRISAMEKQLRPGSLQNSGIMKEVLGEWERRIESLNERAIVLLNGLIEFKENILSEVSKGELFTVNYPLLIKHIIREAKLYRTIIETLMSNHNVSMNDIKGTEVFWNQIMMEHALFIRGLLDPSQEQLILTANEFAGDYQKLLEQAKSQDLRTMDELTKKTLEETVKYRDFKAAGTEGILQNKIASIILPLLADHVLREANHYIRLLEEKTEV